MDASSENESSKEQEYRSIKPRGAMAGKPIAIYLFTHFNLQNNKNDSCKSSS